MFDNIFDVVEFIDNKVKTIYEEIDKMKIKGVVPTRYHSKYLSLCLEVTKLFEVREYLLTYVTDISIT